MPDIQRAVQILRTAGLVAFPTETVYGLGADATNPNAVARIFTAKGRPPTNPLIVHIFDEEAARRYAAQWPEAARQLARRFWPGPLTLVVPKNDLIPAITTASGTTVGLRSPNHPLALKLLEAFGGPIAAPSANRSTRVSPTTADHVRQELGSSVDFVLDGGPCQVGIESTVLDVSKSQPIILRPGSITQSEIESEIGPVAMFSGSVDPTSSAASPGQHAIHYSPRTPAYRFEVNQAIHVARWSVKAALLSIGRREKFTSPNFTFRIEAPDDPQAYARALYANLRALDDAQADAIFIEMPPDSPQWLAVRDRLIRATKPI